MVIDAPCLNPLRVSLLIAIRIEFKCLSWFFMILVLYLLFWSLTFQARVNKTTAPVVKKFDLVKDKEKSGVAIASDEILWFI